MSRTETLAILGGIVDQLGPLGGVEPGTPLRSADWNVMVEALTSLAKLVASREETLEDQLEEGYAPAGHGHRGEATLSWFEPGTRQLLEAATGGSADQRIAQKKIEKEIGGLRTDIKSLRADLEGLRAEIDGLRDADFARARGQAKIENDVMALRGLEDGVGELSTRLNGLDDSITTVLSFRDQVQDGSGNLIDFAALQTQVTDLEALRTNLVTANGELVRIREIESAIARLEQDVTGRDEIDAMIVTRVSDAGFFDDAGLLDQISGQVEVTLEPRFAAAETGITGLRDDLTALDAQIAPLGTRIDGTENRLAGIDTRLDGHDTLAPRLDRAEARLTTAETGLADVTTDVARIDGLEVSVGALGTRVDGLNATVALAATNAAAISTLTARTSTLETTTAALSDTTTRLSALETRVTAIDGIELRLTAVEAGQSDFGTRLDLAEAELTVLDGTTDRLAKLETRTDTVEQRQTSADTRINQLETGASSAFNERLTVLEERVADHGASIIDLNKARTRVLTPTGGLTPILRDPIG